VIDPDIVELLESPCSLIVGTVAADGLPDATRAWGTRVLDDGARLRLLLAANATTSAHNLRTTKRIALTATNFGTFQSVQVKGHALSVGAADDRDRAVAQQFWTDCVHALHELDGSPADLLMRMVPADVIVCEMTVDELFDQTPGPNAGTRLTTTRSQ
jgi:hypothetical protein